MPRFSVSTCAAVFGVMSLGVPSAIAETSIFELRITNNTKKDLTFRLQDGPLEKCRSDLQQKVRL